jgi:hypothetical protein
MGVVEHGEPAPFRPQALDGYNPIRRVEPEYRRGAIRCDPDLAHLGVLDQMLDCTEVCFDLLSTFFDHVAKCYFDVACRNGSNMLFG